ncbi:MAG: dihydroorotate dehydrogenase electron transfer subunit [Acidobacteriota bacterium]|jgi:dihydroorotate dehydrogenase electron transfer subunit|nr:dihydroorotate dehydrogenase electron transfer subunit [Acidobacteriota bacterium]
MKARHEARIVENVPEGAGTNASDGMVRMTLHAPEVAREARPGQFVNLYPRDGRLLLPRPLGIADADEGAGTVTLYYVVVGEGTRALASLAGGDRVELLGPNGNGYDLAAAGRNVLLAGGGTGLPPLLYAAKRLREAGAPATITAAAGFRTTPLLTDRLAQSCDTVFTVTETDRAASVRTSGATSEPLALMGNVIDLLDAVGAPEGVTGCLACGPAPMLKALAAWCASRSIPLQVSLEARMGCGYGACVGCTIDTAHGRRKICADGPVFGAGEVTWA